MHDAKLFHDVVRERRSIRNFLSTPVPSSVIHAVADDARHSPSNANMQPYSIHIVSGKKRNELSQAILDAEKDGRQTPDYPWGYDELYGFMLRVRRRREQPTSEPWAWSETR
jgi:nitroreductase